MQNRVSDQNLFKKGRVIFIRSVNVCQGEKFFVSFSITYNITSRGVRKVFKISNLKLLLKRIQMPAELPEKQLKSAL